MSTYRSTPDSEIEMTGVTNRLLTLCGVLVHPNPLYLTVIAGTIVVEIEGSPARELGPGSGVAEVPSVKHKVSCKEGADCMSLVVGAKAFGSDPVAVGK